MARRTYVYKLRPSRAQETALVRTLDACRHVYNNALEHRREVYRTTGHGVSKYAQLAELKDVRRLPGWEALRNVHCHPLQDALARLDRSFEGFFRRHRAGERAGFPRFQSAQRYRSFTFKEWGNGVSLDRDRLVLSKVGPVKLRLHRLLAGKPKTATVVRKADGWHVHIVCEVAVEPRDRSITDAGWAQFVEMLSYKASSAGSQFVKVDPRHTSQTCAECGVVDPRSRRTQGTFRCVACAHGANADHNAAVNILNRARARPVVEASENVAA